LAALGIFAVGPWAAASYIEEEFSTGDSPARPIIAPGSPHVPELARYLERLDLAEPLVCGRLAVVPVARRAGALEGAWLTMDQALAENALVVTEKEGGGSVPTVFVQNSSATHHVFLMAGEVIAGGKQTRTLRQDVVLAPGQKADLSVFCVEAHRWSGKAEFGASGLLVPQSIQKEMRKGADQSAVWTEVARNNAALGTENATGSLEVGLKDANVQRRLAEVRRTIVPEAPAGSVGFIFVDLLERRAIGAEFFGRSDLARALLPKLVDAYAVDLVLRREDKGLPMVDAKALAAAFLAQVRRAGSVRAPTPGSGAGIQTRAAGLVGDGVSLGAEVVHYGCQVEERIAPGPKPTIPQRNENE
jgi:hypothetical protein